MTRASASRTDAVLAAARDLCRSISRLRFTRPVAHVYNPLQYAWAVHEQYLKHFASPPKQVVFLGMNPGPFGMMQTGVPFGEIEAVRGWMKLSGTIVPPRKVHPKRPVLGFDCARSEVSGRRLWGLFAQRFGTARVFFRHHFVVNYCPLGFLDEGGRNLTPDKLHKADRERVTAVCDRHLKRVLEILQPTWAVAVGDFAGKCLDSMLPRIDRDIQPARILHPSPASPAANRDWAGQATRQLETQGIW